MSVKFKTFVRKENKVVVERIPNTPHYSRVKVNVVDKADALAVRSRRDFVRYCSGPTEIEEYIDTCIARGVSTWYC